MTTGMDKARQLIRENLEKQEKFLDLGNLGLTELPEELWALEHLEGLNLGDGYGKDGQYQSSINLGAFNQIAEISSSIKRLQNLHTLGLSINRIHNISFLSNLPQLRNLDLSSNRIHDFSFLSNLPQLRSLDLSSNRIHDFSFLSSLPQLSSLDLSSNRIHDFSFLSNLPQLSHLDLRSNRVRNIPLLGNLPHLSRLDLSFNQIQDISFLDNLSQLSRLDLSFNQIQDISLLSSLPQLSSLGLGSNQIHDISFLSSLSQLSSLDLSQNQIQDYSYLSSLTQLSSLELTSNKFSDISFLCSLSKLSTLDLSDNEIQDIFVLSNLNKLSKLDLNSNRVHDISVLSSLTQLSSLNLSHNRVHDISVLSSLTQLNSLDLSYNQIQDYSYLSSLTQLSDLYLSYNKIQDTSFLSSLTQLSGLYLSDNPIQDISFLSSLTQVKHLSLFSTKIQDTSSLNSLSKLSSLDLSDNQIKIFPSFLLINEGLTDIKLFNNPIINFPQELLGDSVHDNCLPDARAWFADLEKGAIENFELKLILIGNGRVGKSSIVDGLLGEEFDPQKRSTHAIQVEAWRPKGKRNPLKVNIWDFGGQDIYHGTHRLFLQSRALYLVVWDADNENNEKVELNSENGTEIFQNHRLRYWLDYVQALSKGSPVIVVQNKTDLHGEVSVTDRMGGDHHYNIQFTRAVSAKQGGPSFSYLKDTILKVLMDMREYGQQMPQSWYQVREELSRLREQQESLSHEEYLHICEEFGITKTAPSLLNFLHHTGVVYYQEGLFDDQIILDQGWAIQAIYSLLNWQEDRFRLVKKGSGWFDNSILEEVWKDEYTPDERQVILSYMVSCELCFTINDNEDHPQFVIPQLLVEEPDPAIEDTWEDRYDKSLRLVYRIPFLHDALIHRFITKVGRLAEPRGLWRKGISMKYQRTYARIEAVDARELSIWVHGPQQDDLLVRIRNTFQALFRDYEQVERLIGAAGSPLVHLEEAEKYRSRPDVAAVDGSFVKTDILRPFFKQDDEAKIDELVPDAPKQRAARLYLSWSGAERDQGFRDDLSKHLSLLQYQGKVEVWDSKLIPPGSDRPAAMAKAQADADLSVILLSPDYISSPNGIEEMQSIMDQSEQESSPLIPIQCRSCSIQLMPIGARQVLPRDQKPMTQQADPDAAWTDIVREINEVIKKLGW